METNHMQALRPRNPSELDKRCDKYVHDHAELNPIVAQNLGFQDGAGKLPDYSTDGIAAQADLEKALLCWVRAPENQAKFDEVDNVTAAALENRLALNAELYEAGEFERTLNNLASPMQEVRDSFDLLPKGTPSDWSRICDQSAAVPQALRGFRESLSQAATKHHVAARRQVLIAAQQARAAADFTNPDSTFRTILREGESASPNLSLLEKATREAASAYKVLADWLEQELLPFAPQEDAVGKERYELLSQLFVGAQVDLDETYEWGLEELDKLDRKQLGLAAELYGKGTTVKDALAELNRDPALTIQGKIALREWMQETADTAIQELSGTEFDIPEGLQTIECMLAPSGNGGIYYTGPSLDLTRPGRMWWSVPKTVEKFHAWQERTTVFHEGVPGHHLQIGLAMTSPTVPNLWRKLAAWNSGHGEGWALYAEQLMMELGYQPRIADQMGVLDAERLRTVRVVLDIGVHLQKPVPAGSGRWDAAYANEFLAENIGMNREFRTFELDRYLGWPGQAPSYKIGQRLWQSLRHDYVKTLPSEMSPENARRQFHTHALELGNLPMDTLRHALLGSEA